VVFVPIFKGEEQLAAISEKVAEVSAKLKAMGIRVKFDNSDANRPGWKFAEYELKGVPLRVAIGARDLESGVAEVARRDTREKQSVPFENLAETLQQLLEDIQQNLYNRAKVYRDEHITPANTWEEFIDILDNKGGFVLAHWDGTGETEDEIKELTKATIRCIPLEAPEESGFCIRSGKPSSMRVLFARAY
jgi:prolyl-tRNA synthetase